MNAVSNPITDTDRETQFIPLWVKAGTAILVLMIVLIGVFLAKKNGNADTQTKNTPSALKNKRLPVNEAPARLANNLKPGNPETIGLKQPVKEENPAWLQSQDNLKQIKTLKKQLAQSQERAVATRQQLESLTAKSLELTHQTDALQQTVTQLKMAVQPKKTAVRKIKRRAPKLPLPFTLVSIDVWGDHLDAVLRYNRQIFTQRQGTQFQGWRITVIDVDNDAVIFRNAQGRTATLNIGN